MNYDQRRKEQSKRTEAAILNAALALMRKKGFDAVTVRDICKAAGITTGAFYHHFKSKEELFNKGFAPLDQYMQAALEREPVNDPAQRLKCILYHYADFIETCGELASQYYQRRLATASTTPMDASRYIKSVMVDCFTSVENWRFNMVHNDPNWMADFCYRHFRGIVVDWLLQRREYSLLDKMMEDFKLFERILQSGV